jgi:hypothetical protein
MMSDPGARARAVLRAGEEGRREKKGQVGLFVHYTQWCGVENTTGRRAVFCCRTVWICAAHAQHHSRSRMLSPLSLSWLFERTVPPRNDKEKDNS